jgi:ubiquinone/menaquinone biosynthesis C-methylase UbiE
VTDDIRHPLFARFFDRMSRGLEKEVGRYRDELLDGLTGRVVEIGPGNGVNFGHYPRSVDEVVAVEPEPYLRDKARQAAEGVSVSVTVRSGTADKLGLADASVDAVVSSLVLCSVPDQPTTLAELRRVLKPGGQLRFLEHVRSPKPGKARLQAALDATVWPRVGGGCHCSRDTVAALQAAGFSVERVRSLNVGPSWMHTNPHVLGRAFG